jgi:hypothetical protein
MIFTLTVIFASIVFIHYEDKRHKHKIKEILSNKSERYKIDNLEQMLGGKK